VQPTSDEPSPLAYKLDALATWLLIAALVALCCGVVAVLGFGGGLAGAGIVAGLAGILKALVRRRDF
jgi:hypothetical protein